MDSDNYVQVEDTIREYLKAAPARQAAEDEQRQKEDARLEQECVKLTDCSQKADQEYKDEISVINATQKSQTAQLTGEIGELIDSINSLTAKLDGLTRQLDKLPGDMAQMKHNAEQRKAERLMAINNELLNIKRDRHLLSAQFDDKRRIESDRIRILNDLCCPSTVSQNISSYPTPDLSPCSPNSEKAPESSFSQQAPLPALSPPPEANDELIQRPCTPLDSIRDNLMSGEATTHPEERASSSNIQERPPNSDYQPISVTNSISNSTGCSAELKCQNPAQFNIPHQYDKNRKMLVKDVQQDQVPYEFPKDGGKFYILDCPVCHREDFAWERPGVALTHHLRKGHPGTFDLEIVDSSRTEEAVAWCGILIEDATSDWIQCHEADRRFPALSDELSYCESARALEEPTNNKNLEEIRCPTGPLPAEDTTPETIASSWVMNPSNFIVQDGIYVSPACMVGVPVSKIKEGDEYWDKNWDTTDQLIQSRQELQKSEHDTRRQIEDISRSILVDEDSPAAWMLDEHEQLKSLKRKLQNSVYNRTMGDNARLAMEQYPFHINQVLSKKYITGRGLMVRMHVIAFQQIIERLQQANIDKDPLQWLRGRFAVIIDEYERDNPGRQFQFRSMLTHFGRKDPALCALTYRSGMESQEESVVEDSSTINVNSNASSATRNIVMERVDVTKNRKRKDADPITPSRPQKSQKHERGSCATHSEAGDAGLEESQSATQFLKMNVAESVRSESRSAPPEMVNRAPKFILRSIKYGEKCFTNSKDGLSIRLTCNHLRHVPNDGSPAFKLQLRDLLIFKHPICWLSTLRYSKLSENEIALIREGKLKVRMGFEDSSNLDRFIHSLEERNPRFAQVQEYTEEIDTTAPFDEEIADKTQTDAPSGDENADETDTDAPSDDEHADKTYTYALSDDEDADEPYIIPSDDEDI